MRTKEQTLSELFTELDLDKDGLIGAEELKDFCEDIERDVTLERAAEDIALVDGDKDGKIDKDEWIELMFPKFNIQWCSNMELVVHVIIYQDLVLNLTGSWDM